MTTSTVHKDLDALTMTITTPLHADVERCWQLWSDPRQLERWWGPPGYPATFVDHDLSPGGRVSYHMTGPDGARYPGWWEVLAVDPPTTLEFRDGFADEDGQPAENMPTTTTTVTLSPIGEGTEMVILSTFPSLEAMQHLLEMGAADGMQAALGQIESILTGDAGT